jgi:hypothetical protein
MNTARHLSITVTTSSEITFRETDSFPRTCALYDEWQQMAKNPFSRIISLAEKPILRPRFPLTGPSHDKFHHQR